MAKSAPSSPASRIAVESPRREFPDFNFDKALPDFNFDKALGSDASPRDRDDQRYSSKDIYFI